MPKLTYTTPPPSLMIELREVAADARNLGSELARANLLPSDFPLQQMQELLTGLQALPDGTAEGCRHPLEYARSRLPAIRRAFIHTEEQSQPADADPNSPPSLTRGMVIDQRLGTLVNSVTTALDGYRALASIQPDHTADTAPSLTINTTESDLVEAVTAAVNAERKVTAGVEQIEKIAETSSSTANNLKRQLHDTRGLLRIARVELRMPGFVPRWYRSVIQAVKNYPKLLQNTARAVRIGVDVARPLANAWSHFHHDLKMLILDSVELAARDLEAVGKKWESEQSRDETGGKPLDLPPDFNLAKVREMILSGNAPPLQWRPFIVSLDFTGEAINDLSPLADLTALQSLDLESTPVSNIAPLSNLVSLRTLRFVGTRVSDLSPLAGLTALQLLSLVGTDVSDLSPLANLRALQSLYLFGTKVSDVTPLANLTALRAVDLRGTAVSDLRPLATLKQLETVLVENEARRSALDSTLGARRDDVVRVMNSDPAVPGPPIYSKRPQ